MLMHEKICDPYTDAIGMGLPILYFKGEQVEVLNYDVFLSLKIGLI